MLYQCFGGHLFMLHLKVAKSMFLNVVKPTKFVKDSG